MLQTRPARIPAFLSLTYRSAPAAAIPPTSRRSVLSVDCKARSTPNNNRRRGGQKKSGGSNQRGGKGGDKKRAGDKKPEFTQQAAVEEISWAFEPLVVLEEEVLTKPEPAPLPWWSTFTSSSLGVWEGRYSAFQPATGVSEPVALDAERKPIFESDTRCEVQRFSAGEDEHKEPFLTQRLTRAGQAPADLPAEEMEEEELDMEELASNDRGLVYFEDGSYSSGPCNISPEVLLEEGSLTFTFESCIAFGTSRRMRVYQTLSFESPFAEPEQDLGTDDWNLQEGGDEWREEQDAVDMDNASSIHEGSQEVGGLEDSTGPPPPSEDAYLYDDEELIVELKALRVAMVEERWVGPTGSAMSKRRDSSPGPPNPAPRLQLNDCVGQWKVFEMNATPLPGAGARDSKDSEAGGSRRIVDEADESEALLVLESRETLQRWAPRPTLERSVEDNFEDLAMMGSSVLSLPGGVMPFVQMGGLEDEHSLIVGMSWMTKADVILQVSRIYNGDGELMQVKHSTAVRGGWVGGRM